MSSADIRIFSQEISNFRFIKKCRYRLHSNATFQIFKTFFESLDVVLIKMVLTLMVSAK